MGRVGSQQPTQFPAPMYRLVSTINLLQCRTTCNSAQKLECTPVTSQGILRPTGACACLETSRQSFLNESIFATPVTVAGSAQNLTRVRTAIPLAD